MEGLWLQGPDVSEFIPGVTAIPTNELPKGYQLALDNSPGRMAQLVNFTRRQRLNGRFSAIRFIGRRTAVEGSYGFYGGHKHMVVVVKFTGGAPVQCPAGSKLLLCQQPER